MMVSTENFSGSNGVFIVGSGRCGTTLLRLMLDNHPQIAIADESGFIRTFLPFRRLTLDTPSKRQKIIEDIILFLSQTLPYDSDHFWINFLKEKSEIIANSSSDFDSMIKNIYFYFHKVSSKLIWGDNTPHYLQIADYLKSIFPKLKFIHLIRDGRDTYLSLKRVPWGPNHVYSSALYWKSVIQKGEHFRNKWPNDWLNVRYEDLLRKPKDTLTRIASFLNVHYDSQMLDFYKSAEAKLPKTLFNKQFQKTKSPIDPKNCDKWKHSMSKHEKLIFESIAGNELKQFDYEIEFPNHCKKIHIKDKITYNIADFKKRVKHFFTDPTGGKSVIKYRWLKYFIYLLRGIPAIKGRNLH